MDTQRLYRDVFDGIGPAEKRRYIRGKALPESRFAELFQNPLILIESSKILGIVAA